MKSCHDNQPRASKNHEGVWFSATTSTWLATTKPRRITASNSSSEHESHDNHDEMQLLIKRNRYLERVRFRYTRATWFCVASGRMDKWTGKRALAIRACSSRIRRASLAAGCGTWRAHRVNARLCASSLKQGADRAISTTHALWRRCGHDRLVDIQPRHSVRHRRTRDARRDARYWMEA